MFSYRAFHVRDPPDCFRQVTGCFEYGTGSRDMICCYMTCVVGSYHLVDSCYVDMDQSVALFLGI